MLPWALVYGVNIVTVLVGSLVMFYVLPGGYKSLGLAPLFAAILMAVGYILVLFFIWEQRQDLSIYLVQQSALEAQERAEREKQGGGPGGGGRGAVS